MAWNFGDSFDLYAASADMINGYWDSQVTPANQFLQAGRFAGSRALVLAGASSLVKSSGVNDPVHHFVVSFQQTAAISGSSLGNYFTLFDGATAQCSIVFRSDGAILLQSGAVGGTTLATYTGAFPLVSTWYAFEFEIVINNTTGSIAIRKNGNTVNDFFLGSLNTRPTSTNNYANKLQIGQNTLVNAQAFDDLFWQSGAATGAWLGDLRCYTRMPASNQSVQFTPAPYTQTPFAAFSGGVDFTAGQGWYMPFTAAYPGTIATATMTVYVAFTGNVKCALYNQAAGGLPGTVIASATPISNPAAGNAVFTFPTPPSIVNGVHYWLGFCCDTTTSGSSLGARNQVGQSSLQVSGTYAAFPPANPTGSNTSVPILFSVIITPQNWSEVSEAQQDGLTTYVYDSNPGDADFYNIASIASTPASVIAVTTRAYAQKSDAGTRTAAVQLKSSATTVASPTLVLTTSGFQWAWRTDLTDPNTSAAWTAAAVSAAQIGPKLIA